MKKILVPDDSINIFHLVKEGRDEQQVKVSVTAVMDVVKDLDLTVDEFYTFINIIIKAFGEKQVKV
ncbi:hypothetical protein [Carboxydocella sp. ULO1]|uniref:hypothetical protein n=1 Tax=Carboxydocella sp. ULO1 TaxID=1926599 RepID=UPI0009AC5F23|nr:hypothetical protein [Carboxydocella sp. ULO1]GAW28556.1 hypothetical protein ULO1_11260 [Carboxydocella sp. ULO1]